MRNSWWRWRGRHCPIDAAVEHVERGEQGGGAVALVVVGHRAGAAGLHRQARLGAVERLDLALLVDAQHQRLLGRVEVQPDDVGQLLGEARVVGELERSHPVRLRPCASQMRCTVAGLTPWALAIERQLQCVCPAAWSGSSPATIALTFAAEIVRLAPATRAFTSVSACGPPSAKRSRHMITVGRLTPSARRSRCSTHPRRPSARSAPAAPRSAASSGARPALKQRPLFLADASRASPTPHPDATRTRSLCQAI